MQLEVCMHAIARDEYIGLQSSPAAIEPHIIIIEVIVTELITLRVIFISMDKVRGALMIIGLKINFCFVLSNKTSIRSHETTLDK